MGSSAAAARAAAETPLVAAATVATAVVTAGLVIAEATEAEVGDCFPCHHTCRDSGGRRCRSACRLFASWTRPRRNSPAPGRNHMARSLPIERLPEMRKTCKGTAAAAAAPGRHPNFRRRGS